MEPVFESQTKTKLGSTEMGGGLPTVRTYINDFVGRKLDNYLHQNPNVKEQIQKKIIQILKIKIVLCLLKIKIKAHIVTII